MCQLTNFNLLEPPNFLTEIVMFNSPIHPQSSLQSQRSLVLILLFHVCSSMAAGKDASQILMHQKKKILDPFSPVEFHKANAMREKEFTHQVDHHSVFKLLIHVLQLTPR